MTIVSPLPSSERDVRRGRRLWTARRILIIDMLKSYAAPVVVAAFIVPVLNADADGRTIKLGLMNYELLTLAWR